MATIGTNYIGMQFQVFSKAVLGESFPKWFVWATLPQQHHFFIRDQSKKENYSFGHTGPDRFISKTSVTPTCWYNFWSVMITRKATISGDTDWMPGINWRTFSINPWGTFIVSLPHHFPPVFFTDEEVWRKPSKICFANTVEGQKLELYEIFLYI